MIGNINGGELITKLNRKLQNGKCIGSVDGSVDIYIGSCHSFLIESTGTDKGLESPECVGSVDFSAAVNISVIYGVGVIGDGRFIILS